MTENQGCLEYGGRDAGIKIDQKGENSVWFCISVSITLLGLVSKTCMTTILCKSKI